MARYWRIFKTFFVTSLQRELEFRANFFAKALQNASWVGFVFLIILVIFQNTDSIAGWNQGQSMIVAATSMLILAVFWMFFFSLMEIPEHVRKGTLDFIVTKPIDSQFWVSLKKFNFDQFGTFIAGGAMLALGISKSATQILPLQWVAFLVMVFCGIAVFYSFMLALMTLGIYFVRVDNLWALGETVSSVARYPNDIFAPTVRTILMFGFPLALLATAPAIQLVRGFDTLIFVNGIAWATFGLIGSRLFWRRATRSYSSASS